MKNYRKYFCNQHKHKLSRKSATNKSLFLVVSRYFVIDSGFCVLAKTPMTFECSTVFSSAHSYQLWSSRCKCTYIARLDPNLTMGTID